MATEEKLFSDLIFLFAEHQFTSEIIELLKTQIEAHGGSLTQEREEATVLLVNPSHPAYKTEQSNLAFLREKYKNLSHPTVLPYHWIAQCIYHNNLLSLEELPLVAPIFTFPSQAEEYRPLRTWVSVNITREGGETPEGAQANCSKRLELGGAVIVQKRAQADLLIVDESSQFAKKVHMEKKKYGRDWQRIVERDWVDTCWKERKLSWRLPKGDDQDSGNDSMMEEDVPARKGKGPGRPTGQPRNDYSPSDDDFLCRYLAAHFPGGSWGSRKTYDTLLSMKDKYPPAERHTLQSWHERFKKNSVAFEKRITRLRQDGIDESLKTRAERERTQEQMASQAITDGGADQIAESSSNRQQAGSAADAQTDIIPAPARSARSDKRKLVESNDESLPSANTPASQNEKGKRREDPPVKTNEAPAATEPLVAPTSSVSSPAVVTLAESRSPIPALPGASLPAGESASMPEQDTAGKQVPLGPQFSFGSILPDQLQTEETFHQTADRTMDTDAVDRDLIGLDEDDDGEAVPSQATQSNPGEETQAILDDFARAKAAVAASATAEASSPRQKPRKSVRLDEEVQFREPPVLASQTESSMEETSLPEPERENSQAFSSPRHIFLSPPRHIRPASDLFRPPKHSMPEPSHEGGLQVTPSRNGSARLSIPLRLEVDIRGVTAGEAVTRIVGAEAEENGHGNPSRGGAFETPSPGHARGSSVFASGGRQSLLREEILNSASKRRRTLDRAGGRRRDDSHLDTVYASTVLPPPKPIMATPPPPATAPAPSVSRRERNPSPPLSEAERSERYFAGKSIVEKKRDEYKAKLLEFGKITGWTFGQVATWMGSRKWSGTGEEYWEGIRRSLMEEVASSRGQVGDGR
ncbi:hypothetical protein IAR55_002514 [Kwoniella newhampshirensis]|uniref:BRCT domain-containing protein n=1 Tax=Kwoniella newhampshirensis TaxID=1651941 RepID=A0AAW0Z1P4_9TREE